MIRTKKTTPMSLVQRAEYGNKHKVDLAFRIHADGLDDQSVNGASTLYPSAEHINNKIAEKVRTLRQLFKGNTLSLQDLQTEVLLKETI